MEPLQSYSVADRGGFLDLFARLLQNLPVQAVREEEAGLLTESIEQRADLCDCTEALGLEQDA